MNQSKMENRFTSVMSERSNEELMEILLRKRDDYQSEAVDAARNELRRRNLTQQQFEEITDLIHQKKEQEREKQKNQQTWLESSKNYFRIPSDLPFSIGFGAWLIYITLLIDAIRMVLLTKEGIVHSGIDGPIILTVLVYIFIGYMIHAGKNWARLLFLTFLFTHLVFYPFYIESNFQTGISFGILISSAFAGRLLALLLLFGQTAKNWYRKRYGSIQSIQNVEMRKSILALVITLLFGAYMFRPIINYFYELKTYSLWMTLLVILGDALLLILIFFLWYGYLRREFSKENC